MSDKWTEAFDPEPPATAIERIVGAILAAPGIWWTIMVDAISEASGWLEYCRARYVREWEQRQRDKIGQ